VLVGFLGAVTGAHFLGNVMPRFAQFCAFEMADYSAAA
jgi:hypothetical protein